MIVILKVARFEVVLCSMGCQVFPLPFTSLYSILSRSHPCPSSYRRSCCLLSHLFHDPHHLLQLSFYLRCPSFLPCDDHRRPCPYLPWPNLSSVSSCPWPVPVSSSCRPNRRHHRRRPKNSPPPNSSRRCRRPPRMSSPRLLRCLLPRKMIPRPLLYIRFKKAQTLDSQY